MLRRFASNALANLTTGVSGTVFQIGLTAIAARAFGKEGFGVWALAMSMGAWVPLFSANLSTVITRRLVETPAATQSILSAGYTLARQLSGLAIFVILLISIGLLAKSSALAQTDAWHFLVLVLLLTLAQIWQIALQPTFGESFARERNWRVARTVILSRIGALLGLGAFYVGLNSTPEIAALCLLTGTIVGLFAGLGHARSPRAEPVSAAAVKNEQMLMRPLLGAFAVWSVGSLMIQNGLPAFMSLIAPNRFNGFFLAYTLNMVVVGTIGAASSALLAPLARLRANGESERLQRWLAYAPAATGAGLLVVMLLVWHTLPWVLSVWSSGVAGVPEVRAHLFWLSIQTVVRSMCLVYSVVLSAAGKPAQLRRPIFVELSITAGLGLPLGWWFGDAAFLGALAAAGWITSIFTTWTTLHIDEYSSRNRRRLLGLFIAGQLIVVLSWAALAR